MDQPDIESPCRKICLLDPAERICRGCGRTIDEITVWSTADSATKRAILDRCAKRLKDPT